MAEGSTTVSSNRFSFKYGGTEYPVMKIGGISVEAKTSGHAKPVASGKNAQMTRRTTSTGYYSNKDITVTAAIEAENMDLWKIFRAGLPATYGAEESGKWSENFKDASIEIYDSNEKLVMTYNLKKCQMVGYEVSEFNVSGQEFLTETFTLNCESVERTQGK
jgi:phage tail-like protein